MCIILLIEDNDVFAKHRELYACEDIVTKLNSYQVISQTACQYTLPLLLHNPFFQRKLRALDIDLHGDTFG